MNKPSEALTGAVSWLFSMTAVGFDVHLTDILFFFFPPQVVAVYIAGEAVGALAQTAIGDKLGRIRFMQAMCIIVTIGTVIQTASVNIGMFLAGRALAGMAVG